MPPWCVNGAKTSGDPWVTRWNEIAEQSARFQYENTLREMCLIPPLMERWHGLTVPPAANFKLWEFLLKGMSSKPEELFKVDRRVSYTAQTWFPAKGLTGKAELRRVTPVPSRFCPFRRDSSDKINPLRGRFVSCPSWQPWISQT